LGIRVRRKWVLADDLAIRTEDLTKVYVDFWGREKVLALDKLNLEVKRGEIFGLLGPNGSGKTTTIKLLLGLIFPTAGRAWVLGRSPGDVKANERIGFLPEESYLYRFLNAEETLDFYGQLFRLSRKVRRERTRKLIEAVGLGHAGNRVLREYSRGMSRRIGLAQALINDPELVFLDEPTSGLDPIGTREIKDLIIDLRRQGKTVLLSSHLLADVSDMCDRIAIINRGRIAIIDTPERIKRAMKSSQSIEIAFRETRHGTQQILENLSSVTDTQKRGDKIRLLTEDPTQTLRQILGVIEEHGLEPITLNTLGASLEDAFLRLTGAEMEAEVIHRRRNKR